MSKRCFLLLFKPHPIHSSSARIHVIILHRTVIAPNPICTRAQGVIQLDDLTVELAAGRLSDAHQAEIITTLEARGMEELAFLDFLVR